MKKITMFTMESCPYCKQAHKWMRELFDLFPQYSEIPLLIIDEVKNPETAEKYDYYYVPTYYIEDTKVHEGAATYEIISEVFKKAVDN